MRIFCDLKAYINYDVCSSKYQKMKFIVKAVWIILFNPCFHSVCLYRLSRMLYKIYLIPFAKIIWYINRLLYHVDIEYRADLAGGLNIVHGLGIVIGKNVVTKGKVRIYQGVTLGGAGKVRTLENGKKVTQPIIEDNVTLYSHCMVLGPVVISANSIVKAGKIVTEDI